MASSHTTEATINNNGRRLGGATAQGGKHGVHPWRVRRDVSTSRRFGVVWLQYYRARHRRCRYFWLYLHDQTRNQNSTAPREPQNVIRNARRSFVTFFPRQE